MSLMMTRRGWVQPSQITYIESAPIIAHNGVQPPYDGKFPSEDLCKYVNSLYERMKFFDNGVRMVYGKPDKHVEVDNMVPDHPIPNPPPGF